MIHKSVLLVESMEFLQPKRGSMYLDLTFGGGGHTEQLLKLSAPDGIVVAFDQDSKAIEIALKLKEIYKDRLIVIKENFSNCYSVVKEIGFDSFDGIIMDIGVASFQLDDAQRGFSFSKDGPLDMRMDKDNPLSAREIINNWSRQELEQIIRNYGQERFAKRIALKIEEKRAKAPIETTLELANIVKEAVPAYFYKKIHPATKTFQALRIAVNSELDSLKKGLNDAIKLLKPYSRLVVISFHSLEDKIVKDTFKNFSQQKILSILTKKPIVPSLQEINENPRSRSAKLRCAEKLEVTYD
ncbi:16S rRNA (cytosine1402-N4)-methyltransferase [Desulfurella multipotens]|uniref:Ribosomal RNA small subunit methyltransferase H n=1 Tax=Desulfurella multipotens TaxID=79269 RepID=A0A1G6QLX7_9BACT|nr:16S rRNA (cytosine(1402)-N(4))-methyltransferase RsmH [Desulfurella multipotens]SDC93318.1 16S rRNA (cytosine1402-N4)-methyltransferase [Desulfurella multipotens]